MTQTGIRGSEWRRWDLHLHTKDTNKNDNFKSPTFDDFCLILFRKALDSNISAIGITDYFSIENYKKVKRFQDNIKSNTNFTIEEQDLVKQIFLLPNVELRMPPVTDVEKLINIHCIFNPDYVPYIENAFFNELTFSTGAKAKYRMNKEDLILLGKSIDNTLSDVAAYSKGLSNFIVNHEQFENLLNTNKKFRENVIVVVSNSNKDGASGIQEHCKLFEENSGDLTSLRQSIYRISDCVFSGNPRDHSYFLGQSVDDINVIITKCGSLKPCIHGSDAHEEEKLFNPDKKRYCWIKADLTFEGLKQILYEPAQRVKIQELKPEEKDEKLIIREVRFSSDNTNHFTPNIISFNQNLNVIIGGKSSGKSILLFLLAKALLKNEDLYLLHKNEDEKKPLKYTFNNNLELAVTIASGQSVSSNRDKNIPSILPEIKYIPQNYLSKLAEPEGFKTGDSLRKLVRDLILEEESTNTLYNDFIINLKNDDKIRESLIDEYFEIIEKLELLKQQLSAKGDDTVLKSNIDKHNKELDILKKNAGLTEEKVKEYNALKLKLESILNGVNKINEDYKKVQLFNLEAGRILGELEKRKIDLLKSGISEEVLAFIKPYYENIQKAHSEVVKLHELLTLNEERKFINENIFSVTLDGLKKQKQEIERQLEPFVKNEEIKIKIKELEGIVNQDLQKLKDIDTSKSTIEQENKNLLNKKTEIFNQFQNTYNKYDNIIKDLLPRVSQLGEEMKIFGATRYNFPKLRRKIEEISDGRTQSYRNYPSLLSDTLLGTTDYEVESIINDLKTVFEAIVESGTFKIKDSIDRKYSIKILLDDYFFDNWDVEYDGDNLAEMSAGKASFVILMLIVGLSESKAPILIDQPEDNLDNRSISKEMVEFLKERKIERQIILVTHNPNIVVNADAENIIVANQKGQNDRKTTSLYQFDYINGALENTFQKLDETDLLKSMGVREHIADIVEGGEDAFLKREKKYNFKR